MPSRSRKVSHNYLSNENTVITVIFLLRCFEGACNTIGQDPTYQLLDEILQFRHLHGNGSPSLTFNTVVAVFYASANNEVQLDCAYYLLQRHPDIATVNNNNSSNSSSNSLMNRNDHKKEMKDKCDCIVWYIMQIVERNKERTHPASSYKKKRDIG